MNTTPEEDLRQTTEQLLAERTRELATYEGIYMGDILAGSLYMIESSATNNTTLRE
jgi:hypothetical protein